METYLANSHLVEILQPSISSLGLVKIKEFGVDDLVGVDSATTCLDNFGVGVEALDDMKQLGLLFLVDLKLRQWATREREPVLSHHV